MKKIHWGVLSTAKIAVQDVIPAMQKGGSCKVAAIASRNREKAEKVAESLNIEIVADSYEELLELPGINAIYNPLPNHLHVEWSIQALRAGKHVLCEKPIGLSFIEAQKLASEVEKHPKLKVMEAFMYRHHPRWVKVKELIAKGAIGELRTIQSFFSYYNDDPTNIRNKPDMGGGSLMDIGCYCISVPRFLFDQEPVRILGSMEMDPNLHVDRLTSGMLEFPNGTATFTCGMQLAKHQHVSVFGTAGGIEIPQPFNPPTDTPTYISLFQEGREEKISFDPCNQYTIQGELFSKAILDNKEVPTNLNDALANMKVIDAIVHSNEKMSWVKC